MLLKRVSTHPSSSLRKLALLWQANRDGLVSCSPVPWARIAKSRLKKPCNSSRLYALSTTTRKNSLINKWINSVSPWLSSAPRKHPVLTGINGPLLHGLPPSLADATGAVTKRSSYPASQGRRGAPATSDTSSIAGALHVSLACSDNLDTGLLATLHNCTASLIKPKCIIFCKEQIKSLSHFYDPRLSVRASDLKLFIWPSSRNEIHKPNRIRH